MRRNTLLAELSAEFLGTLVLVLIGLSVTAHVVLADGPGGGHALTVALGWTFAIVGGIHIAGGVSGAHLNPAITIALAFRRGFPWAKVLPYSIAQLAGAFVGAVIVDLVFASAFNRLDPARTGRTLRALVLVPGGTERDPLMLSGGSSFQALAVAAAVFTLLVLAITDARNTAPGANMAPLVIALVLGGVILAFDPTVGYSFNPARDLGSRLMAFVFGWNAPFTDQQGAFFAWVPLVAPVLGSVVGGWVYDFLVGNFLPAAEPEFAELDLEVEP